MNTKVDLYILDGCGRCAYYATPSCKVKNWQVELEALRQIVLSVGLTEELKWGVPCYTYNEKNIAIVSAFKEYCSISFFKGALLEDPHLRLTKPGEGSQAARLIKFTNYNEIITQTEILKAYINGAVELEKSGKKIEFKKNPEPIPAELLTKFDELPALQQAFFALTPSRQRGYIIYFSQPKQAHTRSSRIEKCILKILNGEGLNDKYSC